MEMTDGTPKQIAWAEKIREESAPIVDKRCREVADGLARLRAGGVSDDEIDGYVKRDAGIGVNEIDALAAAAKWWPTMRCATWWINYGRHIDPAGSPVRALYPRLLAAHAEYLRIRATPVVWQVRKSRRGWGVVAARVITGPPCTHARLEGYPRYQSVVNLVTGATVVGHKLKKVEFTHFASPYTDDDMRDYVLDDGVYHVRDYGIDGWVIVGAGRPRVVTKDAAQAAAREDR